MSRATGVKLGDYLEARADRQYRKRKAKGDDAESRVVTALGRPTRPWWLLEVRLSTDVEDRRGLDVIVETVDCGRLALQVKSSERGAQSFRPGGRIPVGLVIAEPADDLSTVYGKALGALILLREASPLR